jgi:hypothetical protein
MVHDTHSCLFIPPTAMHGVTGTYTLAAGAVTSTIAYHRASANSTGVINIPLMVMSRNTTNGQGGSLVKSIDVDYEVLAGACTSVTFSLNKVTRGADLAVSAVAAVTVTQSLAAAAGAETQDQHRCLVTLTNPIYVDNDDYLLLVMTFVAGASATLDVLGAFVNHTLRL